MIEESFSFQGSARSYNRAAVLRGVAINNKKVVLVHSAFCFVARSAYYYAVYYVRIERSSERAMSNMSFEGEKKSRRPAAALNTK